MATSDTLVVGAGTIGLSAAWRLASAGVSVRLVDPEPARGASWAAAGMLAPATEAHYGEEALLRLNLASAERWPAFAAEVEEASGQPTGFRRSGTLVVARDADDVPAIDDLHDFQQRLGLRVERLTSREARRLEPGLAPTTRGGLLAPDDHQVDNRALVSALLTACTRAGVDVVERRVVALRRRGDRVTGVRFEDGEESSAGTVVLAAGAWSGQLDGVPPGSVPVRPVKGQLLHLRGPADVPLASANVRVVGSRAGRPAVYVVPRADGRIVIGATAEEMGFDTTVTAGAVLDLLREAYDLLPGLTELALTETTAGVRPGTPDNAPLIGAGAAEGLVVATGHYRNGVLLTPITADAVAALVTGGAVPDAVAAFPPDRFREEVAS